MKLKNAEAENEVNKMQQSLQQQQNFRALVDKKAEEERAKRSRDILSEQKEVWTRKRCCMCLPEHVRNSG